MLRRRFELRAAECGNADHADIAVAPRLLGDPFDQIVHVPFRRAAAVGLAGAANIAADVHVAAAHQKIGIAALGAAEPHARPGRLRPLHGFGEFRSLVFLVMRRDREQRRKLATDIGPVDVDAEPLAVAHRHHDIAQVDDALADDWRGASGRRVVLIGYGKRAGCALPRVSRSHGCLPVCRGDRVSPFQGDAYIVRASVVKALRDCGSV